jgi:hypothetical protein
MCVRKMSVAVLGMWLGLSVNGFGQQALPSAQPPSGGRMGEREKGRKGEEPEPNKLVSPSPLLPFSPSRSFEAGAYQPATLAQTIARTLRESGQLSRYSVSVAAQGGVVDLRGEVADDNQRAIVITLARSTPGVVMVRDGMQVRTEGGVMRAQVIQPLPLTLPAPQPLDKDGKGPERIDGQLPEPMPIFQPMPGPNPTMQPPPLPPYAWPTYAPYNNYSRVAYPDAYPYEQWPFIGPMYPFPRVPLGWRSVSLTWEDGNWWFHRNPTGHDWWRVRYH